MPKTDILVSLIPAIEREVYRHNKTASRGSSIALRIAVHCGDVLVEPDGGVAGETLNHTFRLLDSAPVRSAIDRPGATTALIVSSTYYDAVVGQGWDGSPDGLYEPIKVDVKETQESAWLRRDGLDNPAGKVEDSSLHPIDTRGPDGLIRLEINDLPPTSLYIAISDIHNFRLYSTDVAAVPLENHIETAVLLAPRAVMHCADPFRMQRVASAIEEFPGLLEGGSLLFLMGENAVDPSEHFRPYIQLKVDQYKQSHYGARDVDSLTTVESTAFDQASSLFDRSAVSLVRGFSGTVRFVDAVQRDLQTCETIVSEEPIQASGVRRLDLTLRQLLQIERMKARQGPKRVLASNRKIDGLQSAVRSAAQNRSFSRQILLALILEALPALESPENSYIRTRIESRISTLHLRATLGSLSYLPVTSESDRQGPMYFGSLLDHLGYVGDRPHPSRIGAALTMELRAHPEWPTFVRLHMTAMTHVTLQRREGELNAADAARWFSPSNSDPGLVGLKKLLEREW